MRSVIRGLKGKRIGVLMGGLSEEREISFLTGRAILKALKRKGYDAVGIDAGRDIASVLVKKRIDVAFLALHGRYGEDGCVQGMLEVMGIPYTGSGVRASSVAIDKISAKKVFLYHGISTAGFEVADKDGLSKIKLKPPVVVKPATQGSAIGVSIVRKRADLPGAVRKALRFGGAALVEEFIEGRELTVSILNGRALPVIEIRPKDGFYDYRAKYTKGMTEYLVPAPLEKPVQKRVVEEALNAYRALGCGGGARVDLMLGKGDVPYVLEVNTIPGMTELSLFPKAAAHAGMTYEDVAEEMLRGAGLDKD
ncbi:MAG: D-alanine--D-alanine ligase [Deltaproteobacteria bacterium]|nr:D-alanine--D-alanine ligase [Deltaproteobacteria bacterium]